MLGAINGESLLRDPIISLIAHLDHLRYDRTLFVAILVIELIAFLHDGFEILIDGVNGARRVHPTATFVETLIDEKLSPGYCAVGIQPFVTGHLQLRSKEERRVRIDQQ